MNDVEQEFSPQSGGIKPTDIYYVVFRHKWMIVLCSLLGVIAAAGIYFFVPRAPFKSEAKILIRYVLDVKSVNPNQEGSAQVMSPTSRGDGLINSEMEILSSFDLISQVVDAVGPDRILQTNQDKLFQSKVEGNITNLAAVAVIKSTRLSVLPGGNAIKIEFSHPDASLVQEVVGQMIKHYRKKHFEVHRELGVLDDIIKQKDQLDAKLAETEKELRQIKSQAGVIDIQSARTAYMTEISKMRQDLYTAEADLASFKGMQGTAAPIDNANGVTNAPTLPKDKVNEYVNLQTELFAYAKEERSLLAQFTEEHTLVKRVRAQIQLATQRKTELEKELPGLSGMGFTGANITGTNNDAGTALSRMNALQFKVNYLRTTIGDIENQATKLDELESRWTELQRKKDIEDANLRFLSANLEKARFDEALGPSKIPNISIIEEPTPPARSASQRMKMILMAVAGGAGGGIGLAFALELFLLQTIRRPVDLEKKLAFPLFLTVPEMRIRKRRRAQPPKAKGAPPGSKESPISYGDVTWNNGKNEMAPWDPQHPLRPYFDSLRDQLVAEFEMKNMNHKPKMVAVTSCSRGAGVSTIATGLATALSETGGGNVLLVDMNDGKGAAHPIHNGKPGCGLPDVLEEDKRDAAQVQSHLYLATASQNGLDDKLPRILPKRFTHLVPKMKASDYDYIIFDMPPVSQTSVTARLAAFMDMTFMVVESEKTNQEALKRAQKVLRESNAPTTSVLNKLRKYVPSWLDQDL